MYSKMEAMELSKNADSVDFKFCKVSCQDCILFSKSKIIKKGRKYKVYPPICTKTYTTKHISMIRDYYNNN